MSWDWIKITANKWYTGLQGFEPILKSLVFDPNEQTVYLGTRLSTVDIINLQPSTGSIVATQHLYDSFN